MQEAVKELQQQFGKNRVVVSRVFEEGVQTVVHAVRRARQTDKPAPMLMRALGETGKAQTGAMKQHGGSGSLCDTWILSLVATQVLVTSCLGVLCYAAGQGVQRVEGSRCAGAGRLRAAAAGHH